MLDHNFDQGFGKGLAGPFSSVRYSKEGQRVQLPNGFTIHILGAFMGTMRTGISRDSSARSLLYGRDVISHLATQNSKN